jgi:hypothetical protein
MARRRAGSYIVAAMLRSSELTLPDDELAAVLKKRSAKLVTDKDADEAHREVAFLFELDQQVRSGGFSQYFFNTSGANAFDAWFATDVIDGTANELLSHALQRLGVEFGVDLELHRLIEEGGGDAIGRAYAQLLVIYQEARKVSDDLKQSYVAFAERLRPDRQGIPGFASIDKRFLAEVDVKTAVCEHVRADPEPFLSARR